MAEEETQLKQGPYLSLDNAGLHITSDTVAKELERKSLSPSLVNAMEKCHAKWVFSTFVEGKIIPVPPDNARRRGSMFHKVLEELFALPPEERTKQATREMVKKVLTTTYPKESFTDMVQYPEAMKWLQMTINGYYALGADPTKVNVATIKDNYGKEKLGLEVFVKGNLGDTKRDILGFVDRISVHPSGGLIIEDYKTGGTAHRYRDEVKDDEGLDEARQQIIYAMLLAKKGYKVAGARLIFPAAMESSDPKDKKSPKIHKPTAVTIDLRNKNLQQRTIKTVQAADKQVDEFIATNTFEYTPGFLCAWCPLAKACPKAIIKPYAKMEAAFAEQPELDVLAKGIDFK